MSTTLNDYLAGDFFLGIHSFITYGSRLKPGEMIEKSKQVKQNELGI